MVLADFNATGGTGTYLGQALEYLCSRYSVFLYLNKDQRKSPLVEGFARLGVALLWAPEALYPLDRFLIRLSSRLKVQLFYSFLRDSLLRLWLDARYHPDFNFISQGGGCNYFAFLKGKKPLLMVTHSLFDQSMFSLPAGGLYIRLFNGIRKEGIRICSVSEYSRELFRRNIHCESLANCTTIVHNFGNDPGTNDREASGIITILTIGHVIGYKNPLVWLEVAREVVRRYPAGVRFVWAGDGELLADMRRRSSGMEAVAFVGFQKDTESLYRESGIYFQPSSLENHSIAVVEAMAQGLPCVVSDVGAMRESIEDGQEGFVSPANSVEQYVESLSVLIEDAGRRRELGTNARKKYERLFTKARWEQDMDAILRSILDRVNS